MADEGRKNSMSITLQLVILTSLVIAASSHPTRNVTISVPEGFSTHGTNDLFCTPASRFDVLLFFLTNYVAHAATVRSIPGQRASHAAAGFILALLFPYTGLLRALIAFGNLSRNRDALSKAYHAGALWIVQSSEDVSSQDRYEQKPCRIHGICELPKGYYLRKLNDDAKISIETGHSPNDLKLCTSYNAPKAIIAVAQAIYASVTLYRSRGDQISRYGYASFGLTVIPYIIMSIVNFLAGVLFPEYPSVFMILSKTSDEAVSRGSQIEGAVGRLVETDEEEGGRQGNTNNRPSLESAVNVVKVRPHNVSGDEGPDWEGSCYLMSWFIFGAVPFIIIGILTHFHKGHSTPVQRAFLMVWLVLDIFLGPFIGAFFVDWANHGIDGLSITVFIIFLIIFGWSAIAGFVMVGQMVKEYGSCTLID